MPSHRIGENRTNLDATGIPIADTHAGKSAVQWDHPCAVGGLGSTGVSTANALETPSQHRGAGSASVVS